jgi:signal transduction histidine kinase
LIRRAVENLIINAMEAMPQGGSLVATSAAEPHAVELEIADTGPAMSDAERHDVFDLMPAEQRGSSGWGLAVVRRIAEMHGGRVSAANCPDGGVAFTLHVPSPVALEAAA